MLLGSALCAGAPVTAFPMLLFGRAILGMGCAGMNIVTRAVLAHKVSLAENAKNTTIFTIVAGVGYGIGPTIGGYLTSVSWRWVFIINCPLGLIGLVAVHFVLRPLLLKAKDTGAAYGRDPTNLTFLDRLNTIDLGGQFLFLFGVGLVFLAITWGGSYYPWRNVKVLAPLIVGAILVFFFVAWEYLMEPGRYLSKRMPTRRPMIPYDLLASRNAGILIDINFITGMGRCKFEAHSLTAAVSNVLRLLLCWSLIHHCTPILVWPSRDGHRLLSTRFGR